LKVSDAELLFKYADYYLGTNRCDFQYATSLEEDLELGVKSHPNAALRNF